MWVKWRGLESAHIQLWSVCSNMRGGRSTEERHTARLEHEQTRPTQIKEKTCCFCIGHTIQEPLKPSAPTSESFIRNLYPLHWHNFHIEWTRSGVITQCTAALSCFLTQTLHRRRTLFEGCCENGYFPIQITHEVWRKCPGPSGEVVVCFLTRHMAAWAERGKMELSIG